MCRNSTVRQATLPCCSCELLRWVYFCIASLLVSGISNAGEGMQVQLFMWQRNIVGVAHFVQDWFEVLGALDDAPDDASTSSSSALAAG